MIYSIAQALVHGNEPAGSPRQRSSRTRKQRSRKGLRITLKGRSMYFKSLDDFSFAIECRTSVPAVRFDELVERSPADLWREADSIKLVEKNLVNILEDALCDASACGPAIRELGLQVFTKDHDWRLIMAALNELNDDYEGYKRLALIKYMQYLGARQEILRLIFAIKNKAAPDDRQLPDSEIDGFDAHETVLFEADQSDDAELAMHSLHRLPQGEAVRLHTLPGHAVEIRLARHTFDLINDNGWVLCDPHGHRHALADRQNMIGRGSENDITLNGEFRNVSRRHLIAEPLDDHIILLTDISSHGTFAPPLQTERSGI